MTWWERLTRWEERHQLGIDSTLTVLTGLLVVPISVAAGTEWGPGPLLAALWAVGTWAPLAWRRRNPVASVVTVYAFALAHLAFGTPTFMPADVAVLIALYSVTVHGPRWAHRTAILSAVVGSLLLSAMLGYQAVLGATRPVDVAATVVLLWVFCSACAVATWAFGLMRRSRRETIAALRDRAERLEVERDQQAQIATAAERTRIAREMHDIVAHSLSVVVAQADGGRYAAAADPDAATRALGTIAETGRAALADMRRLLGVLREPDAAERSATTPYTPQPAEQDLEGLVEQVRASGVRASLVRMGTARQLPPGVGLTVYRICQEALTNVLKHAGPDPAVTVLVQWRAAPPPARGAGRRPGGGAAAPRARPPPRPPAPPPPPPPASPSAGSRATEPPTVPAWSPRSRPPAPGSCPARRPCPTA
ncbi:sensor histidine kinase, partial [Cellulomonas endometrii]|uniref:sensor histidine kinase n=1 Tax=Cellulomonas endometrii TaxID=3036301 RepID=UPI0024AE48EA